MVEIKFDDEMMEEYKKGQKIFLHDDDNVNLYITNNKENSYTKRIEGKKFGSYIPSLQDIERFNTGKKSLFYNGKTDVYIKKTAKGDF